MDKWQIYIQEARTQLDFAKRSWFAFIDAESRSELVEMFLHLQHFLSHAAMVDTILDPKAGSTRGAILSTHLNLSGLDLKPFRRLRNHLEHFDERLDNWVAEYDGHPFFDMNLITGSKGFPTKAFLRALDAHTFKFHGEDYDLDLLYETIVAIESRL